MTQLSHLELPFLDFIQAHMTSPFFDRFWVFITHLGDAGLIWIGLTLVLLLMPKTRKVGLYSACALIFSLLLSNGLLKNLIGRPRPYTFTSMDLLIKAPWDFSFPSGHTSASFAFAFVILKERPRLGKIGLTLPVVVLACLMAFSRLYLYVHFPSDILFAIFMGWVCYRLAYWVGPKVMDRLPKVFDR